MPSPVLLRRAARALVVATVLLGSVGAQVASAVTVRVDDDKAQCPRAQFRTIGEALAAVPPSSTIRVCPGQYSGPIRMTKPGVSVVGLTRNRLDVVLLPPVGPSGGIVEMSAPATAVANVTLRDKADPDTFELTCFAFGVVVDNGPAPLAEASRIDHVTVLQEIGTIHDCPFFASGTGVKIGGLEAAAIPGRAIVHRSTIVGRSDGVAVFAGSTAVIRHNVIGRAGGFTEQSNGAVTLQGGTARIVRNDLAGYFAGVFLFHGGHALIGGGPRNANTIHDNTVGVALVGSAAEGVRARVADNDIHHNDSDGVRVETPNSIVSRNRIDDNGGNAIQASAPANQFLHNVSTNNGCVDATTGDGTAGTANTWVDNIGATSSPPGICLPPGS